MPHDERSVRYSPAEQRKLGSFTLEDEADGDAYVEVKFNAGHTSRKSKTQSPRLTHSAMEEAPMDGNPEWLSTASASAAPPRVIAVCCSRSSWFTQAFQYTMTEGGMALMAAFILLLLSLAGAVTMYAIAPSRTTGVLSVLNKMFGTNADEPVRDMLGSVVPEALTLLQAGLQAMLVPAAAIGLSGVLVLGSADRRRPGCFLVGYGCAALILGLALLYLLLRVAFGGHLSGLDEDISASLLKLWEAAERDGAVCEWERAFPCSGFDLCCVTNTTPLEDEGAGWAKSSAWDAMCFMTLPNGSAVTQRGVDVTLQAESQCAVLRVAEEQIEETAMLTSTACALITGADVASTKTSNTAALVTCENYVVGHLTSTAAFALCLLLGMTVCSLVSGVVALISNMQRSRTSDFVLVNDPAGAAANGSAMTAKGRK